MEALNFSIFILPTIALVVVIVLYMHFAKKVPDRKNYRNYIICIAVIAFSLNFIWELLQGPLYEGFQYDGQHIAFCALASIADMLMVLILLFGFALMYTDAYWVMNMNLDTVLPLILIGITGAILGEFWHISRGDWIYAEAMPMVPFLELGISPVLQFAVLPYLIFLISKKFVPKRI